MLCLPSSVHEVHIDDEQLDFLRDTLHKAGSRPVLLFTHAPPMGSGLKVLPVSPGRAALQCHVHMSGSRGQASSLLPGVMHAPAMASWVEVLQLSPGRAWQGCVALQTCPVPGPRMHPSWQGAAGERRQGLGRALSRCKDVLWQSGLMPASG